MVTIVSWSPPLTARTTKPVVWVCRPTLSSSLPLLRFIPSEINYGTDRDEDGQVPYVHLLNSTLTATGRTLCCLLENYQEEKGIRIPECLQKFMAPFTEDLEDPTLIPFVKEAPELGNKASRKKAAAAAKK